MYDSNYVPQPIKSKSDISKHLMYNVDTYKEEARQILEDSSFTSSQKEDLENIMRQYYYSLNDIIQAIKLLND